MILDDWALSPLEGQVQHDLLEVIDDRASARSTIVTSQLPIAKWHDVIGDPSVTPTLLKTRLVEFGWVTAKRSRGPSGLQELELRFVEGA